jgi:hypothetical protein
MLQTAIREKIDTPGSTHGSRRLRAPELIASSVAFKAS